MQGDKLDTFFKEVMSINNPMGGVSAAIFGISNSGFDIIVQLRRDMVAFVEEYRKAGKNIAELKKYAKEVEGSLLSLIALTVINHKQAHRLIERLHRFTEER